MRPTQKTNRPRGRGSRKPNGSNVNRVYDSSGPEGKVRGTPQQIIEKYLTLARDAQTSGDRVMAENFLQHAEHYQRVLILATAGQQERRDGALGDGEDDAHGGEAAHGGGTQPEERSQERQGDRAATGQRPRDGQQDRADQRHRPPQDAAPRASASAPEPRGNAQPGQTVDALATIDTVEDAGEPLIMTVEEVAASQPQPQPQPQSAAPRRRRAPRTSKSTASEADAAQRPAEAAEAGGEGA